MKKMNRKEKKKFTFLFVSVMLLICFTGIFATDMQLPFTNSQETTQNDVANTDPNVVEPNADNSQQGPQNLEQPADEHHHKDDNELNENGEPKWWPTLEDEKIYGRYKPRYIKENQNSNVELLAGVDERAANYPITSKRKFNFKFWSADSRYACTHEFYASTLKLTNQHPSLIKTREYGKVFCAEGGYGLYLNNSGEPKRYPVESNEATWNTDTNWNVAEWTAVDYGPNKYINTVENKVYRIACEYYGKDAVDNNRYASTFTQMAMWNLLPLKTQHSEGMLNGRYLSYFTGSSGVSTEYTNFLNNVVKAQYEKWDKKPSFSGSTVNLKAGGSKVLTDSNKVLQYYQTFEYSYDGVKISHTKGSNEMTVTASTVAAETVNMTESQLIAAKACKYGQSWGETYVTFTHTDRQNLVKCNGTVTPIGMSINFKIEKPKGYAKVKKVASNNNNLVKLNPIQYNLQGAEYTIYSDYDCTRPIGTVVTQAQQTDANGNVYAESNTIQLNLGTYWAKETKAPKGYLKDPVRKKYEILVKEGQTTTINTDDPPYFDPMTLELHKKVPGALPEFQKYLEGAEYTVRYYPDILNTEAEVNAKTPLRTWVFKTDANGEIYIRDKWKVGGDELFKKDNGEVVGLIGTYTFEETKAPAGFLKNKGIEIRHVKQDIHPDHITAENSPIASELPNPANRRIKVKKRIPLGHIFDPFGTPTAIFELTGRDIYGNTFKQRKSIHMSWKDTYDDANKRYAGEVVFDNLPPGEYTVREISSTRYLISDIYGITPNGTVIGEEVEFELVNADYGHVSFKNILNDWEDRSHMTSVINKFRTSI